MRYDAPPTHPQSRARAVSGLPPPLPPRPIHRSAIDAPASNRSEVQQQRRLPDSTNVAFRQLRQPSTEALTAGTEALPQPELYQDVQPGSITHVDTAHKLQALDIPEGIQVHEPTPVTEAFSVPHLPSRHRRSSSASVASTSSSWSISSADVRRSNSASPRPSVSLYGRHSTGFRYQQALEELQQLEVDEFLARASKRMEEVHFDRAFEPRQQPRLEDYTKNETRTLVAYLAFAEDWACALAENHLPRDLLAVSKPSRFSFSQSRAALERLYILLPPSLLETLLAGHLVDLYRWKDPVRTAKYASAYLALWHYNQLPAAIFAFVFYQAIKPNLFPPSASEVRHRLAERRARSREAMQLDEDLSKRDKLHGISSSLAQSVGVATLMGGIGIDSKHTNQRTNEGTLISDSDEDDFSFDVTPKLRKHKGKFGMYKLVMEMLDRFGPSTMMLISDGADYLEKAKNFMLWRRPAATRQSLLIIGCWTVFLSILPGWLQLKLLLLWVWFQFFVVWPVQDRFPRYRRALNPFWWLLWNVPNDAESALEILKVRAAQAAGPEPSIGRLPRNSSSASLVTLKVPGKLHRRSASASSVRSVTNSASGYEARHFALFKGLPGYLIFTDSALSFEAIRGFRRLSSKLFKRSTDRSRPASPSNDTFDDADRHIMLSVPFAEVMSVKKESRLDIGVFDTDGLQITFTEGRKARFASVHKRDEAFAFILRHSTRGIPG